MLDISVLGNIKSHMIDVYDLTEFAPAFFKIADKEGQLVPFVFNRAQKYIHQKIEEQRQRLGYVRVLILKGRQQGCCFSPHMKVLTSDYRWIEIKDVKIGDELIACDENTYGQTLSGRKHSRKFRTSVVEHTQKHYKHVLEVELDTGAKLELTGEHRMLCKKRGGDDAQWRHAQDFKIGDYIRVVARHPNYQQTTYEDGWFAGIIDGEGSWRGKNGGTKRLSIHQVDGPILHRIKKYLTDRDIPYCEVIDYRKRCGQKNKLGDKPVHRIDIHRLPYLIEIFSRCRPTRFLNDKWYEGHELPGKAAKDGIRPWAKIVSIKSIGKKEVVDLQTSTKTFICEGLVSHNSTYIQARYFHKALTIPGTNAFILTHMSDATQAIFEMTKRYNNNLPDGLAPKADKDNDNMLLFNKLNSRYRVGTAGSKTIGRSMTNQLLHLSEYAFYDAHGEIKTGIEQTVADRPGTEKIKESTANGIANAFYTDWQDAKEGKSDWEAIFVPWYWDDGYTREAKGMSLTEQEKDWITLYGKNGLTPAHLAWRRNKLGDFDGDYEQKCRRFNQEYPFSDEEAFINSITDTFITIEPVQRARKTEVQSTTALIIGVDPARGGEDRTAITHRRGRCAYKCETFQGLDTMQLVGKLKMMIERDRPTKMFIDCIGIGAGVVDRLHEMGYEYCVVGVNVARAANNPDQFLNLRAELWSEMREWLNQDMPVQIPDDPELQKELCGLGYDYNSSGRLVIESKKDAKKRGMRSPDKADSLMLTFAYGQHAGTTAYEANLIPERTAGLLI